MNEITSIQERIRAHEHFLDCLNTKIFYLEGRIFDNEYDANENRIEIARVSQLADNHKAKLKYLHQEFRDAVIIYYNEGSES